MPALPGARGNRPPAPTEDVAAIQTQSAQTVVADLAAGAPTARRRPRAPLRTRTFRLPLSQPQQSGEPAAVANYNTAIFSGPGTNYVLYAALLGGASAKVVGKSADGLWWAISIPVAPTGAGWVDAGL